MRLQDKVAVITGAASGMGLSMARMFSAEGAMIVAGDWNKTRLDAVVTEITTAGRTITALHGNIGVREDAEALIDHALATHGRIDVLVNNAGVMDFMQGTAEISDDIWRKVMSINLDGLVNIASTASLGGGAAGTAYTSSKHGLIGLTKSTAWMYALKGIRCNAICPGGTATNIAESMTPERMDAVGAARAGAYAGLIPAYLQPEDIASLALFLASDDARHVNGAVIAADGGWSAA
ncbi:MAG: SDR family oxidoreductase [Chloroflexi bacterium]|nr:SDR family oxidoreductase [Chloroflexota bacterium]